MLTFVAGVPVITYPTGTDRGGPEALADLAVSSPYSVDLYRLPPGEFDAVHEADERRVPPGMPAERLADDPELAARTRSHAFEARLPDDERENAPASALEAFLDDDEKIAAKQEQAREEAECRAEEWGLDDQLRG